MIGHMTATRRRRAAPARRRAIVLLGATALLAGCGGSSGSSSGGGPSAAKATAAANAINLTAADLPGYTSTPNPTRSNALDQQLSACAGTSAPSTDIVNINSPSFARGSGLQQQTVASNVSVKPTDAIVRSDLAALRSSKAQDCLRKLIPGALSSSANAGVHFGAVQVTPVPVSVGGADGGFGYRIVVTATAAGQPFSVIVDEFGASAGREEISLNDFAIAKPVAPALEQRLFALLATRAGGHRL